MSTTNTAPEAAAPKRQLTLFDSTSIIVGIIIGATIYESTPLIASNVPTRLTLFTLPGAEAVSVYVPGAAILIGVWILGGLLSFLGALCYVELANMFPEEGGDYVYLTQAFGRRMGFVFGWCQLWVVRPGSIGAMAFVFARYANRLFPLEAWLKPIGPFDSQQLASVAYAVGSVAVLSAINFLGVRQGKWTQNILTTAKVLGLAAVFTVGFLYSAPPAAAAPVAAGPHSYDFALAMIFVLYAYGGWNEMAYVGAEIRDPRKNIFRALVLGTVAVSALYVVLNLAFLHALGDQGVRTASAVAANVVELGPWKWGDRFISALICVSALGAVNGLIFTGARIYYAMGKDQKLFAWLAHWNERQGIPRYSLAIQALITLCVVAGFGLTKNGFASMVIFTTPVFWAFMVLVGLSVYRFRDTVPNASRPYRLPGYPFTPFIFCVSSLWMAYRAMLWAYANSSYEAFWAIGLLVAGIVACLYDPRPRRAG